MSEIEIKFPNDEHPGKIIKWRVSPNTMVSAGRILLLYQDNDPSDVRITDKKLRTSKFGRINNLLVKAGDVVQPGQVLLTMTGCKHPTVMKDLCAECGADLRQEALNGDGNLRIITEASVPMVHSVPELKVCPELAEKIGKEDEKRLLSDRKLALLVDLDQTIVHTTNDNVPAVMKDVFHYQLYGPNSPWYHTRLRPGTRHFLSEMSKLYELHICTFGARNYAHTVAALLDKEGALFSHRILSRDECFNPASKTANLKALFPCGDDLVCIIDDREDVWQGCGNLVQVKPYHFFRHTGDIHAPPGLEKRDLPDMNDGNETNNITEIMKNDELPNDDNNKNGSIGNNYKTSISTDVQLQLTGINNEGMRVENTEDEKKSSDEKLSENSTESVDISEGISASPDDKKEVKIEDSTRDADKEGNEIKNEENEGKVREINKDQNNQESFSENEENNDKLIDNPLKKKPPTENDDHDDYLLYLEDILRKIHAEFYKHIDENDRKSLREIIPKVRERVLKGLHLTFSGLIPTQQKLYQSRAYRVAKAFGAEVTQDLTDQTTHLVAIKPGTAKVNIAKKNQKLKIVNPDWLWSCAERWERVDERLFPLTAKARGSRIPPPHCSSPVRTEINENQMTDSFASSINPLMSFTQEEIDNMDKEVEEDMSDPEADSSIFDAEDLGLKRTLDESDDSDDFSLQKRRKTAEKNSSSSSSSGNIGGDNDNNDADDDNDNDDDDDDDAAASDDDDDDDDDEDPITRFRRGEGLPDDLDLVDSQDSVEEIDDPIEEDDDREWNAMGAALEREFLSE